MSSYTLMNVIVFVAAIGVAMKLRSRKKIRRLLKISVIATILAFPWLYFGIAQGAWGHTDPGPRFLTVPLNELALSLLVTFVNGGILLLNYDAIIREARRGTEAEHCTPEQEE